MARTIRVSAPATVANVGCAFDILGFAVHEPGDVVVATLLDEPCVRISAIHGDEGKLPRDPERNTAGVAVQQLLSHLEVGKGIDIELHKAMPLGSGLGSSAASAAAALYAASLLLEQPLSPKEMLPFAMEAERIACGTAHADNVAPALLGGFVLIRSYAPLDVIEIEPPEKLHCSVVHPLIELRTEDSRNIVRKEILLKDAVTQWGNIAGLITGLLRSDYALIGRSLSDVIIEPERSIVIPGFNSVKQAALDNGALGCSLSGSGPSLFALSDCPDKAQAIGTAMKDAFGSVDIEATAYVSKVNTEGPTVKE